MQGQLGGNISYHYDADKNRLRITRDGKTTVYDTTGFTIVDVAPQMSMTSEIAFTGPDGIVTLAMLKPIRNEGA